MTRCRRFHPGDNEKPRIVAFGQPPGYAITIDDFLAYGGAANMRRDDSSWSTSLTLVAKVRSLDAEAWQDFVELYGPLIFHWCQRNGLNAEDARDVGQEVFRKVAASISSFRRDRDGDTFRGWLWTLTRNAARDFQKGRKSPAAVGGSSFQKKVSEVADRRESLDDDDVEMTTDRIENDATKRLAQRAMELIQTRFNEKTMQAFLRTAIAERPATDVAQELGMTPDAVRQAKSRVLRRLREWIEAPLEAESPPP